MAWAIDLNVGGPFEGGGSGGGSGSALPQLFGAAAAPSAAAATPEAARLRELLVAARRLGYRCCAVAYATAAPLRAKDACRIPMVPLPQPPVAEAAARGGLDLTAALDVNAARRRRAKGGDAVGGKRRREESAETGSSGASTLLPSPASLSSSSSSSFSYSSRPSASVAAPSTAPFVQLSRITVAFETAREASDTLRSGGVPAAVLSSYDLVAAAPGSAEAMLECARSGLVDIIDLDMAGGRSPFPLVQRDIEAVLAAGVVFEVPYAPAVRDASCRRSVAANAAALLRLSRGRGVILCSAARVALELRAPAEAAALARLWGLSAARAREAQAGDGARAALAHAEARLARARGGVTLHVVVSGGGGSSGCGGVSSQQAAEMAAHAREAVPGGEGAGRPWLLSLGARGLGGFGGSGAGVSAQGWLIAQPPAPPLGPSSLPSSR